jgi:hypothetical protein
VPEVVKIIDRQGDAQLLDEALARGFRIFRFTRAFNLWKYPSGRLEWEERRFLWGNTDPEAKIIRLRSDMTSEKAAGTLVHEIRHALARVHPGELRLEEEVSAFAAEEEFRIRHGIGPQHRSFRRADGTVDDQAIRKMVYESSAYNPTGREVIDRRFEGDKRVGEWRTRPTGQKVAP